MSDLTDQSYLLNEQYKDASNLNARIQLHARFSTNKRGWNRWLFDQFKIAPGSRILELGCGPGKLWLSNRDRIADDWQITLSDFSPGMLQEAQQNLSQRQHCFTFRVIDAQTIPFDDASLDVVIANHMLYHVPDRSRALAEIRRVLKADGRLYASTIGDTHQHEIRDLMGRVDRRFSQRSTSFSFTLENGAEQLAHWFASVTLYRYQDALVVTEVEPLIEYILSGQAKAVFVGEKLQRLRELLKQELIAQKAIYITKDSGLFEAFGSAGRVIGPSPDAR
ncbi:MAG TPA: methyltransferase domain-containing protein [Ktedonobacterales bacterium]|jgi:ubiquinone/menaquinone biosynthesis C-methylase UbiE